MSEFASHTDVNNLGTKVNNIEKQFVACCASKEAEIANLKESKSEIKEDIKNLFVKVEEMPANITKNLAVIFSIMNIITGAGVVLLIRLG